MTSPSNHRPVTYGIVGDALHEVTRTVPSDEPPPLPPNEALSVIGKRIPRLDALQKVTGEAKYTFGKSLALAVNGIVSLSKAPLRVATWFGLIVSAASFLLAVFYVIKKLTVGFPIRGWASTVVIMLFLGGVQLVTIGIIGEYISRIYDEVKRRPLYVVREFDNLDTEPAGGGSPELRRIPEPAGE